MIFFPSVIDSICDFDGVCSQQHQILRVTILVSVVEIVQVSAMIFLLKEMLYLFLLVAVHVCGATEDTNF